MGLRSRHSAFHGRLIGAKIRAQTAREQAAKAAREADRAEAEAWSIRMEGFGGPAQPSPTLGDTLKKSGASAAIPIRRWRSTIVRRPKMTPSNELERYLQCKDCSQVRGYPYERSHLAPRLGGLRFLRMIRHRRGGRRSRHPPPIV